MDSPFNPLDKVHLGESIRDALLRQPVHPLPPGEKFLGAGIYAIYYSGPFPAYEILAGRNRNGRFELPLYVGKAVPQGARKGLSPSGKTLSSAIYKRMKEHSKSIEECSNLEVSDFHFRYLSVDDIWIPLGETLMIKTFRPIWNHIDGFGIHTPGANRPQKASAWDTLHPGRGFVTQVKLLPNAKSQSECMQDVYRFIDKYVTPSNDVP